MLLDIDGKNYRVFLHQKLTMYQWVETISLWWDILLMFTSKIFLNDLLLVKPSVH